MSIPQGSVAFNADVGEKTVLSLNLATTCNQVSEIIGQAVTSLNATLAAVTSQLSVVEAKANALAEDITALTGWQTAQTDLTSTLGAAAALSPFPADIVAYLKLQATAMISVNTSSVFQIVKQLIQLNNDYTALTHAISTLSTQITEIPRTISAIENAAAEAAARFPGCILP